MTALGSARAQVAIGANNPYFLPASNLLEDIHRATSSTRYGCQVLGTRTTEAPLQQFSHPARSQDYEVKICSEEIAEAMARRPVNGPVTSEGLPIRPPRSPRGDRITFILIGLLQLIAVGLIATQLKALGILPAWVSTDWSTVRTPSAPPLHAVQSAMKLSCEDSRLALPWLEGQAQFFVGAVRQSTCGDSPPLGIQRLESRVRQCTHALHCSAYRAMDSL